MNRRATVITLLILLLILLLVAQALTRPPKVVFKRPSAKSLGKSTPSSAPRDIDPTLHDIEALSASEEQKAIVEMVQHSGMLNPSGYYEVFGQVQNIGQLTARNVRVFVTFREGNFQEIARLTVPTQKPTLRPGERSDFKVTLPDTRASSLVGSYVTLILIDR